MMAIRVARQGSSLPLPVVCRMRATEVFGSRRRDFY